jgi:hypothetical protein
MSADIIITAVIGLGASIYVGRMALASWRRLTAPARGQSACGGCSGCGTTEGHAETEDDCEVRASELVVLGTKRQAK